MITYLDILKYLLLILSYSFIIGYIFCILFELNQFFTHVFFTNLSMYITIGFSIILIIFYIFSFIYIDLNCVLILSIFMIFLYVYKNKNIHFNLKKFFFRKIDGIDFYKEIFSLFIFLLSFVYFSYIIFSNIWSPAGDAVSHGEIISLILYNKKIPFSYHPISDVEFNFIKYPLGFHILSAVFSLMTNLFSGQIMLYLSSIISLLIPNLIYSISYLKTNSCLYASISFILVYIMPKRYISQSGYHDLLVSKIIGGTYPSHLGIIFVISVYFISLIINKYNYKNLIILYLILSMAAILSYYPYYFFVIFNLLILVFNIFKEDVIQYVTGLNIKNIKDALYLLIFCVIMYIIINNLNIITDILKNTFQINILKLNNNYDKFLYALNDEKGIVILFSFILSVILICKHEELRFLIYYYIFFIPVTISYINKNIYYQFWILIPKIGRYVNCLYAISLCVISISLYKLSNKLINYLLDSKSLQLQKGTKKIRQNKKTIYTIRIKIKTKIKIISLFGIFYVFLLLIGAYPYFLPHLKYKHNNNNKPVGTDYEAIVWIISNISKDDLILNDRSWEGLYLTSFQAQKVVNTRTFIRWVVRNQSHFLSSDEYNKIIECNQIFDNPSNYSLIKRIIEKYDIKYFYVSANNMIYWWGDYKTLNWNKSYYLSFFNNNPNLLPVWRKDYVVIYKTIT